MGELLKYSAEMGEKVTSIHIVAQQINHRRETPGLEPNMVQFC